MIIVELEQGSPEWLAEKIGKPSASNASKIITNSGTPSKQSDEYMFELAAEIITGRKEEYYKNANMIEGNNREAESRNLFSMLYDVDVKQVGVIYKDEEKKYLCSPDGIVNNETGLELKNVLPKTQVKYLLDGEIPSAYFSQVQMSLYVTGFKYWYFMSYVPAMQPLIIKVERDEPFINKLAIELDNFCKDLQNIVKKIR